MNWIEIFKRTGYVLIVASILTFVWWISPLNEGLRKLWWNIPIIMTMVLGFNITNMISLVFVHYYFRHVFWVIFLCWLGWFPLALFMRVSFDEYVGFSFCVTLLAFIGAFVFRIWHLSELSRGGGIHSFLTPEQVVTHLGKPNETISSESGMVYLYNRVKVFFADGHVKAVERIPPPLPNSLLGFSPEQIVNDLGFPKRVINLDSKIIYFYKDMKIIFVNGQVADIQ